MGSPTETVPDEVARDHDRQLSVRDDVHEKVDQKVGAAINRETNRTRPEEQAQVESVAQELKAKSVSELRRSDRELESGRSLKRIYQFVNYAFYVVYGLIGLMIGLELVGARNASGFMKFMQALTTPILAPFRHVMPDPALGSSRVMFSYALALVVYGLIHLALKGVFRILVHRDSASV